MRRVLTVLPFALLLLAAGGSSAAIRDGALTHDETPVAPSIPLSQPRGTTVINFDDTSQPCVFASTVALRDEYLGLGVRFTGPGPLDGGAVLDACGGFGVSGFSAPNFLAFNCGSALSSGGTPVGPERLTFTELVSFVEIFVGSGSGAGSSLSMQAYNDADQVVAMNSIVLSSTLHSLSVVAPGIRYVVLGGLSAPCVWVADDLTFEHSTVSVEPTSWAESKNLYR